MRKIFTWLAASLLLTAGLAFAMTKSTLSESEFASEIGKKTFAVFVKDGSRYTMYKPNSPSSAESELRSALPGGRMEIYTSNIALRDYLDEAGWYDDLKTESISGNGMWHFTAWAKR